MYSKKIEKYDLISISHYFPPRVGGIENMAHNLLEGLSKKGIRCLSIYGSQSRYFKREKNLDHLSFKPLNIFDHTYPIFGIKYILGIFRILVANPEAKVIIHSRHLTSSLFSSFICRILKHPYTLVEHNGGPVYFKNTLVSSMVNWLDRNIFVTVIENSEDILAVSKTCKDWIHENFGIPKERIYIIHNSFNTNYNIQDLDKKENLVIFASKWIRVKDPNTTLKAYIQVAKKYPKWNFMMIGEGNDLEYIKEELPKNVQVIDNLINQTDLFKLLEKSKIYVNSSLSEGLALGIIEAISFGNIPVISNAKSNLGISKELNTKEFIFRRRSVKDLARTIEKAIYKSKNKTYLEELVKRNTEVFSKEQMVEKYYIRLLPKHYENTGKNILSIVIPVYNEERTIVQLLQKVSSFKLPNTVEKEIIIVNDHSTDSSKILIEEFLKVQECPNTYVYLENRKNRGKSQSVKRGVLASTGNFVVTQDADLEYKPEELKTFVELFLKDHTIDVIYGNRFNKRNSFSNGIHSWGNRFVTATSNIFTKLKGFAPKDMETCYKMGRGDIMRKLFKTLESQTNFGLEPELTAKLARYRKLNGKRLQFRELDIYYKPRSISQGKKMRWFKHGFEALLEIIFFNTQPFTVEEYFRGKKIKRQF